MSKWEMVRLGEVCEKKVQSLPAKSAFEIVYIDIASIDNISKKIVAPHFMDAKDAPSRAKQVLQQNDILVSTVRPNLNAVAVVRQDYNKVLVGSTGYCVLRCTTRVVTEYIFYFCQSKKFVSELVMVAKGASYPAVSDKDVKNLQIPLPPLEVQNKIAQTLEAASELIALRKKQLAELDNLIKSTFYEMFGDPVTNEKGWDHCLVEETIKVLEAGWSVDGVQRERNKDEIAVLKVSAVTSGYFRETEYKVIDKNLKFKKYVFPHKGDLLFSRANTRDLVGATCMVLEDYPELILPDKLWRIEFNSLSNFVYMKYILSDHTIRNSLSNISTGTSGSMYNISMDKLKSTRIPLPPLPLQNQFAEIVTKIEEQKSLVQKAIDESQYLFDSLMSEYFE